MDWSIFSHLTDFFDRNECEVTTLISAETQAEYAQIPESLHPELQQSLHDAKIKQLYTHQLETFEHAIQGRNVVMSTSTGSGKTLAFALPLLQTCLREPNAKALFIYPLKALAQDQLQTFENIGLGNRFRFAVYDGDTPKSQRSAIRKSAHGILTNPDMLHVGMLPQHELWIQFLKNLRFIIIDEAHVYDGVFAMQMSGVLRRLLRLCEWHRSSPVIIAASATLSSPQERLEWLTGQPFVSVQRDGAAHPEKRYYFVKRKLSDTSSASDTAARLLAENISNRHQTLLFNKGRIATELVLKATHRHLSAQGQADLIDRVMSYRSGYTAQERRDIEKNLRSGNYIAVTSTNALEVGIDIGHMDCVVMNGFPDTTTSFWQQAGRAGRRENPGACVMIAEENPIDQLICADPEKFLSRQYSPPRRSASNPIVLSQQIKCAAYERALGEEEVKMFAPSATRIVEELCENGELRFSSGRYFYTGFESPAPLHPLRGLSQDSVAIFVNQTPLATMEYWRALQIAFIGAVYLHAGETYVVCQVQLTERRIEVKPTHVDYFTLAFGSLSYETLEVEQVDDWEGSHLEYGQFLVDTHLARYQKRSIRTGEVIQECEYDSPHIKYGTTGVRIVFSDLTHMEEEDKICALHGAEHALLNAAAVTANCSTRDLLSTWYSLDPEIEASSLCFFDLAPGGSGISGVLFDEAERWIDAAIELLEGCSCDDGCPLCLMIKTCTYQNLALSKVGALKLLQSMRGR